MYVNYDHLRKYLINKCDIIYGNDRDDIQLFRDLLGTNMPTTEIDTIFNRISYQGIKYANVIFGEFLND